MRETMLDKLQNKCCICGKNTSYAKVKIILEARSMGFDDYNRYYFTCISCASAIELYMQHMKKYCIKFGGNKDD